jgi:hypothetical protein
VADAEQNETPWPAVLKGSFRGVVAGSLPVCFPPRCSRRRRLKRSRPGDDFESTSGHSTRYTGEHLVNDMLHERIPFAIGREARIHQTLS